MLREPTAHELQVMHAADKVAYLVDRAWVLPILIALRRGAMDRDVLHTAAQRYRHDRPLSARMFSHTAQDLEAHELLVIARSPEHPDDQTGARYALTDRARAVLPLVEQSLLLFSRPGRGGDSEHPPADGNGTG